jgi:hypothetical protein
MRRSRRLRAPAQPTPAQRLPVWSRFPSGSVTVAIRAPHSLSAGSVTTVSPLGRSRSTSWSTASV